jgi:FkbM family methyltransferase
VAVLASLRGIERLGCLNKPQYLAQPKAVLRRFFGVPRTFPGFRVVPLRWGLPIEVDTREDVGREISNCGIFEIPVLEAIFRLADCADAVVDAGANIGFMTSAALASAAKMVIAFEPHPDVFRQLEKNVALWTQARPEIAGRIFARQAAVSDKNGVAALRIPYSFSGNHGLSTLEAGPKGGTYREIEVPTVTLAQVVEECGGSVGLLKMDIEGHEFTALNASRITLEAGKIRDIIFEDHEGMDSEVSRLLERSGYTIFGLNRTPFGPALLDKRASVAWYFVSEAYNILATRDPERAVSRMRDRGFRCLRNRRDH